MNNRLQEAYVLARQYALEKKEPVSSQLMLIAQENLLQGFIDWTKSAPENGKGMPRSAKDIMNYATPEIKEKFTQMALKATFEIVPSDNKFRRMANLEDFETGAQLISNNGEVFILDKLHSEGIWIAKGVDSNKHIFTKDAHLFRIEVTKVKLELLYRCAANYKTYFDVVVDLEEEPEARKLNIGDELTMGEYGTKPENEFFNSEEHPYSYNHEYDHNLLDITEIKFY